MAVTHAAMVAYLRQRLGKDRYYSLKALIQIYERQMDNIAESNRLNGYSGYGFTLRDRDILSSIADDFLGKSEISDRQMAIVLKLMPKYAGQIIYISDPAAIERAMNRGTANEQPASEESKGTEQPATTTLPAPDQPKPTTTNQPQELTEWDDLMSVDARSRHNNAVGE